MLRGPPCPVRECLPRFPPLPSSPSSGSPYPLYHDQRIWVVWTKKILAVQSILWFGRTWPVISYSRTGRFVLSRCAGKGFPSSFCIEQDVPGIIPFLQHPALPGFGLLFRSAAPAAIVQIR